jgi:hypothetical protein
MILRLLCIWLVFYSLLSSLMHGTMNLKFFGDVCFQGVYGLWFVLVNSPF